MVLLNVIIVEDSEDDLLLLLRALHKGGFEPVHTRVETGAALAAALKDDRWQIVISDHAMPRFSAPEALEVLKESGRDLPFIIVSGTIGEDVAVTAMRSGAHDYIMKGNLSRLAPAVQRELRDAEIRRQYKLYRKDLEFLALHDPLTRIYNRLYYENELERLDGGPDYPVTFIAADLDGLRLINDTMGYKKGDQILQVCADLLKQPLRQGDILARVGSDEFMAILPQADQSTADQVIAQIRETVENYNLKHQELPLSIALGYAISNDESSPLEEAAKRANSLKYEDKQKRSESARSQVVKALMATLAERDYITGGHAERLEELCLKVGQVIGLDNHRLINLSLVAQVHDLGKVGIPDQILFKESSLSDEEWAVMRRHPEKGFRIAQSSPDLAHVAGLILRHHEKWDGSGYPLGLKGEEIPIECRILSIVDAYDAMTNNRPYREAKSKEEALLEITNNSGTQFDPSLVETFFSVV